MTIPTQQSTQTFLGNGVTTAFDFSFVGDSSVDIVVMFQDTTGEITTLNPSQYTLFLNPASVGSIWGIGGTVTYPTMGSPIEDGTKLIVSRVLPLTQVITISNQGDFAPDVIEEALDTLEMQIQQVAARSGLFRGIWITDTFYNFGDMVIDGANGENTGNWYICTTSNTSGVWATDLANGDWNLAFDVSVLGPISRIFGTANRITATINGTEVTIDIAAAYVGQSTITTLGTIATGIWNATKIAEIYGGTNQNTYTTGDILYASATNTLSKLADAATGNALISGGIATAPSWGKIGLTTHISGTLPVLNGGTNQTSYTDGQLLIGNSSGNTLTKATLTAGGNVTITNGNGSITIDASGSGIAKAWVNFNGTGTVAIRSSFNVSSITDNGTGDYTVNWNPAIGNATYSFWITAGSVAQDSIVEQIIAQNSGSLRFTTSSFTPSGIDAQFVCAGVFST